MPVATKNQALTLLTNEIQDQLGPDELLEVYDEVFPNNKGTEERARENLGRLRQRLVDHLRSGLEIDEIIDLWGLILPTHRNIWYDEEGEQIHYTEEAEAVPAE